MVTVVDPLGTPVPVYNRSGTAIIELPAGLSVSPTPIPAIAEITVVIVNYIDAVNDGRYLILPDDADVGDVIEVYENANSSPSIYPPSGETFINGASGPLSIGGNLNGVMFRRVTSTHWSALQST